jgi:hypothetical protein
MSIIVPFVDFVGLAVRLKYYNFKLARNDDFPVQIDLNS